MEQIYIHAQSVVFDSKNTGGTNVPERPRVYTASWACHAVRLRIEQLYGRISLGNKGLFLHT